MITRDGWGFSGWATPPAWVADSRRTEFFVHYEGGRRCGDVTGVAVPQGIHAAHLARGWAGIGYNFVVDQLGQVFEGRGWGLVGAHCPGHNTSGWGVQVHIGGDEEPSAAALAAVRGLYDEGCRRAGRTLAMRGHRDGIATTCPGEPLYAWVQAGMPIPEEDEMTPEQERLLTQAAAASQAAMNLLLTGRPDAGLGSDAWPYPFSAVSAILVAAQTGKVDAAAIAAAIPEEMAQQVVDHLVERMARR